MHTPIETMLAQALKDYEQHLQRGKLRGQSIGHRMRGAEDFALFLLGRTKKNERIQGVLSK